MVSRNESTLPHTIKKTIELIDFVKQTVEIGKAETYKCPVGGIRTQKYGCCVQDSIEVTKKTAFDTNSCPSCRHRLLGPVGMTVDEINIHNDMVRTNRMQLLLLNPDISKGGIYIHYIPCVYQYII